MKEKIEISLILLFLPIILVLDYINRFLKIKQIFCRMFVCRAYGHKYSITDGLNVLLGRNVKCNRCDKWLS